MLTEITAFERFIRLKPFHYLQNKAAYEYPSKLYLNKCNALNDRRSLNVKKFLGFSPLL